MAFHSILNRFSCRTNSWSKLLLSYGGKEVFIKSILQSLPTYALSVFLAPRGTLEDMLSEVCHSRWACKEKWRGWAMLAWDKVCLPKGMRGLSFRDLRLFNLALLGRQVWRLLTFKDTLCYRVLSSKYFLNGDLFHPKKVDKPSYTWSSIFTAAKALESGFGWQVEDGNIIKICDHNWGFKGLNGESLCFVASTIPERKVCDLWINNSPSWNKDRVRYGFIIPMASTLKSAYLWLLLKQVGFGPHRFFWKTIWKLKTLPKICVCAWRLGHDLLPTNAKISSIRQNFRMDCPRCGASVETLIQALKDYPTAHAILTLGGLDGRLLNKDYLYCVDWLEDAMLVLPLTPAVQKWEKPPVGSVKINVDATVLNNKTGFKVIIRDCDGFVLGGGSGFKKDLMTTEWMELYAFEEGLNLARSLDIDNVIFETDYASLVNKFKKRKADNTIIGHRTNEIHKTLELFAEVSSNAVDIDDLTRAVRFGIL
ncbi:hypothetical protein CXB51_014550 [Gossypium anomalum]|uniref:RNase H type-1 domain-containing protein n=1 Tax=Gossypium anomalum TaxID=47600 RepID=A0A8J6D0G4_9ROSI|nr:hypothetical protein CXB51_014550 [Gossypium anomalum]